MKRARSDTNAAEIAENLQRRGMTVHFIISQGGGRRYGVADTVVGYRGTTHLLEIKRLGEHLRDSQVEFVRLWTGCFHWATNSTDAFNFINECYERRRR